MSSASRRVCVAATLIGLLLLALAAPAAAQEPGDAPPTWCAPPAARLAGALGVRCERLLALHAEGVGWGEMMVAWRLAEGNPGSWRALLDAHRAGQGWGEVMMARRLGAALGIPPNAALRLKHAGLGWGQIRRAQALAARLGIPLGEAADLLRSGADWDRLREDRGLPPGPPPWAGGPPGAAGPADEDLAEDDARGSPPPWAGGPARRSAPPPGSAP